ncbi:MAG: ATP phosphoribosyltransferase [Nitrospira sp.]|nr:MAG: ATP phosphoribosyltransferase [Nitrospira sp.]
MVTIALSKGKLMESALALFRQAGYDIPGLSGESRRLIFVSPENEMTFLIVRPSDVPTYVEYGGADAGIVGKDVLLEQESDVYEPLDLGFGACRISVAALRGEGAHDRLSSKIRIATKYPRISERYFNTRGIPVEIVKLYGSIELAPVVGLADRIVDLVETGSTLKAHDLAEIEVITQSTARFIVNRASFRLKQKPLMELIRKLRVAVRSQSVPSRNGRSSTVLARKRKAARS